MKKPVVLRILKADQLIGVKQFLDPQIVIGRQTEASEVQVALEGESVSIIHASIEDRGGTYYISDLGSTTGTRKNGESVLDVSLNSGDVLKIGDYTIEFFIGVPKPKVPGATEVTASGVNAKPPPPPPSPAPKPPVVAPAPPPVVTAPPVAPPPASTTVTALTPAAPIAVTSISAVRPPAHGAPPSPIRPVAPPKSSVASSGASKAVAKSPAARMSGPSEVKMGSSRRAPGAQGRAGLQTNAVESKRHRKTFAPPGHYADVKDFVRPSKGTIVEVLLVWGERVISSHHFGSAGTFTIGSHPDNDIVCPVLSSQVRKLPILQIDKQIVVLVTPEMRGELIRGQTSLSLTELMRQNRLVKAGNGQALALEQGEMIRLELGENVSVVVRFVSDSPKPLVAPLLDLTASETTGVVLAFALVATLWLYMYLYQAAKVLPDQEANEPLRTAMIVLTPPTPTPLPEPLKATPPPVVQQPTPVATPIPEKVHVAEKTQVTQKKAVTVTNLTTKQDNGKSANAAPNAHKTGPRIQTSVKQGGAIKTTDKEGAQMQSKSRDVTKAGVFSVFGNNGAQNKLAQSTTGSGELAGMASQATGKAGSAKDRAGEGLGSELKDTGVGGTGKPLEGIAGGVGTQGRGSGNAGYGTGGLGNRQGVKIVTGGAGEEIQGTIDRDAIRRVIMANLRSIKACYEKELNKHPDMVGKIVLTWEIGEQGRVLSAGTKSNELGSKEVADCVVAKLKTWRFPEPPANQVAEVSYPFLFSN